MGRRKTDFVEIVEALYRLDLSRDQWLAGTTDLLRPLLDRHHLGILANYYQCVDPCSYVPHRMVALDVPVAIARRFFAYVDKPHPTYIADSILSRRLYFCCRIPRGPDVEGEFARMHDEGAVDKLTLNTVEPDGSGCCFGSFQADHSPLSPHASVALRRIGRHLSAAFRLRRRFENAGVSTDAASVVMDPNGKLLHARVATGRAHSERLAFAVRAKDRARSRRRRDDSLTAIQEWQALVEHRWMLLDHVECDGRRFVLAVEREAGGNPIDLLSERERDVLDRMLSGQSTKVIASELSLAPSTVRVLVARAAAKVRARSRADLLEKTRGLVPTREPRGRR
jgi:DNA-binding CsgD family transcriptional regulator